MTDQTPAPTPEEPALEEPPYIPGPEEVAVGMDPNIPGRIIYETPDPVPPQTLSDYTKISSAVNSDINWSARVKVALEISGMEIIGNDPPRAALLKITKAVVGSISCTVDGTIDTTGVTDEAIDLAIAALGGVS